jgi:hypothetical protein
LRYLVVDETISVVSVSYIDYQTLYNHAVTEMQA